MDLLTAVLNLGRGTVAPPLNGFAANTLQLLQLHIILLTMYLSFSIHHSCQIVAIVLAVPRCIIHSCVCLMSFCTKSLFLR